MLTLNHRRQISRKNIIPVLVTALVSTLIIAWFYPHPKASRFNYEEGRPWNYSKLIAPFDIPIHPSEADIQAAKDSLDARFVPVYIIDQAVCDTIVKSLPAVQGENYNRRLGNMLREAYARGVVDHSTMDKIKAGQLDKVRILDVNVLSESSTSGFLSPRDVYARLDSTIKDQDYHAYFSGVKLHERLRPNIIYSPEESKRHYDQALLTLTADRGVIQQGQTIIDKGAVITAQDYTNLQTYEQMSEDTASTGGSSPFLLWLGQISYVVIIFMALTFYLIYFEPRIYANFKAILFLYSITVMFFLLAVVLDTFVPQGLYLVPLPVIAVLVMVFFNGRTALFTALTATMICSGIAAFPLEFIFLQFCGSCAAVVSLRDLTRRSELVRTSMLVAVTYAAGYTSLELLMNGSVESLVLRMYMYLIINAMLISSSYLLMFLAERLFGFVSVLTLVELADTNTPLLRELAEKCPGTFQHSMAMGNLAAEAATRIGANAELVRAGALYHDIGKSKNPAFFTENQHGVNPHDGLTPEQSAKIVISHVTDGLKIADRKGLPAPVKAFITEHHGKGKAKYFYYTWCNQHPGEEPDDSLFTYPGPDPSSKETSILMMADSVEAAARSLKTHTPEEIRALVDKIIDSQVAEGRHNDSDISFRDIQTIKDAFAKQLMTIYHSRISYPDAPRRQQ